MYASKLVRVLRSMRASSFQNHCFPNLLLAFVAPSFVFAHIVRSVSILHCTWSNSLVDRSCDVGWPPAAMLSEAGQCEVTTEKCVFTDLILRSLTLVERLGSYSLMYRV
jgi:hypothetical protein